MSAPTLFRAPGDHADETPRCICGAAAPGGFCAEFPACLPQVTIASFEELAARFAPALQAMHSQLLRSSAHTGHNRRAQSKALRSLADVTAAFRDAGVQR